MAANVDKSPLEPRKIIDWLLSLEAIYGDVNFVSFGFSYDATQILMALPFDRAKEIATKKSRKTKKPIKHPTLCGKYAIDYLKGKWLKIWELRDGDHPYKDKIRNGKLVTGRHGVPAKELDYTRKIIIEDFLGFYQSGFVKVLKPLVKKGYVEGEVFKTIEKQKANRSQFCDEPFEDIKHYCGLELVCASKALVVLRDGFDRMGIKLTSWSGAGSPAAALIKKEKLKKEHYFDTIKTLDPDPEQIAAHHAYFGGRIELLKQGVTDKPLFGYDIVSAYPAAMPHLPSMQGGKFIHKRFNFLSLGSALSWNAARDKIVAPRNVLSMFKMEWLFPLHVGGLPIPFYPLPFRTKRGGILFPNSGSGWYMRDEVLGALDWIKKFWPTDKIRNADKGVILKFHECYEFHPANDLVPYKFVPDLYEQRRAVKSADPDDPLQMNIKLVINSLYGKTAQNVSGEEGSPPASACPWYAAAITAYCRMRALKAALHAPHDIIMFCTDGIMSTSELKDLPDVIEVDDDGTPKDPTKQQKLGDWEFNRLKGGGFLVSGVYYLDQYNGKTKDRSRGTRTSNFVSKMSMKDFFHNIVLPAWRKGLLTPTEDIKAQIRLNQYISIGAATASLERFEIAGRWGEVTREGLFIR